MNEFIKDNLLIICPNEEKIKILETLSKEDKLYAYKDIKSYKNSTLAYHVISVLEDKFLICKSR